MLQTSPPGKVTVRRGEYVTPELRVVETLEQNLVEFKIPAYACLLFQYVQSVFTHTLSMSDKALHPCSIYSSVTNLRHLLQSF
jgi:hypothetical protein